ncbi:ABC transporter permease [Apilactobacillus kunkeei]|uniref:ABC transporter permease n=1 Tax=Apilactobacillus kunkeei TaxID=148814 RepID=UPI0039E087F5
MIRLIDMEILKIKRSSIIWTLIFLPVFSVILIAFLFANNTFALQSLLNQWSILWIILLSALISGLVHHRENASTQYKMILSSPTSLFKYEFCRIIALNIMFLIGNFILLILVFLTSTFLQSTVSLSHIVIAIIVMYVSSMWMIPFFLMISRLLNMFFSILIAFFGMFIGVICADSSFASFVPFSWPSVTVSSITKMNVNGVPMDANQITSFPIESVLLSLLFFLFMIIIESYLFTKQEVSNA